MNDEKQGFSSQEEVNVQTVEGQEKDRIQEHQKEKVRLKALHNIHPAQQIKKKQYSLQPDMQTGWKPKMYLPKPIPLIFYNDQLDYAIQKLIKMKTFRHEPTQSQQSNFIELVYLGPRYESTYSAWYQKPFDFPYVHMNKNKRLRFTDRQFVGQYWNAETQNHLHFDSFFQSGNLDVVFKIGDFQYDLFMRVDSNTRGHLQWYNFKVKNMKKGATYKFNICNFLKGKSLYTRGMKPFVYSKRLYECNKQGWHQCGQNIKYEKKTPKSFKICKFQVQDKPHRLSFEFLCQFQNDEVQFSYCVPYQYSRLKTYLQNLQKRYGDRNYLKVSRLAFTLGGLQIPMLTITSDLKERAQNVYTDKKLIVASGRIHPGQSNGSFMMEGFIDFLCEQNQQAELLRNHFVFKIIPMVNPDGVVLGNYRTSLSGKDLNREFISPDQHIFPQIYHLKKYIFKLRSLYKKDFLMYLDFHGHSTKKNCFTYGPEYSITNNSYYQCRIFPKLISLQTEMFRYFSCIFKISQCKERTLRAVLLKYLEIQLVYTIQVSNGCFYDHEKLQDVCFDDLKWIEMGGAIANSVQQYASIFIELDQLKKRKREQRLRKNKEKVRMRTTLIKRQNKPFSRERLSLSATKAPLNFRLVTEANLSNKLPVKGRSHQNQSIQSTSSSKQLPTSTDPFELSELNPFIQLKNSKFSSILKQIYTQKSPAKKKFAEDNQVSLSEQKQQKKSARSDDNISEGGSDSSSSSQDLSDNFKKQLFKSIKTGSEKIHSLHYQHKKQLKKKSKVQSENQDIEKLEEGLLMRTQTDTFLTQMDQLTSQLQEFQHQNKLNGIKMNQLRSKRHIYLKKKSYQINNTPSPKKQTNNGPTAKIVNFQFSLNPIKPISHLWKQKQSSCNTSAIHSLYKQPSEQNFDSKPKLTPFAEYMNRKNITSRRSEHESTERFRKCGQFSNERDINNFVIENPISNKQNSVALLRKTQGKRDKLNTTFYKALKPNKDIYEDNLKGKRISSQQKQRRCITQMNSN